MSTLDKHEATTRTKLLVAGDSGSGKTAAISTLVKAGLEVFIIDTESGLDVLLDWLTPDEQKLVHYKTFSDNPKGKPTAWAETRMLLNGLKNWEEDGEDFGPITDWGPERVLVWDTMSSSGDQALTWAAHMEGLKVSDRINLPLNIWGNANVTLKTTVAFLTSNAVNCNLVVLTHIREVAEKSYPAAVGSTLPKDIAKYFNTVVRIDVKPGKQGRVLRTVSDFQMSLKTASKDKFEPEIPVDLGYIIRKLQGK